MNAQSHSTHAPDRIAARAMLVELNISQWSARKLDKKASKKVVDEFKVSGSAKVKTYKSLLGDKALAKIDSIAGEAARFFEANTLPWSTRGLNILCVENYETVAEGLRERKAEFERAVRDFLVDYDDYRMTAQVDLGQLFNEADYPPTEVVERKFSFRWRPLPFPTKADFRVSLADGEKAVLAEEIELRVKEEVEQAQRANYIRLHKVVAHMAERLAAFRRKADGKIENGFHGTLVTNITELLDVLPKSNLTLDPELDAIVMQARAALCSSTAEVLKTSDLTREATAKKAAEMAKKLAALARI